MVNQPAVSDQELSVIHVYIIIIIYTTYFLSGHAYRCVSMHACLYMHAAILGHIINIMLVC